MSTRALQYYSCRRPRRSPADSEVGRYDATCPSDSEVGRYAGACPSDSEVGRYRAASSATAFTLVELLVVVAIIALLLAVLMPSLKRAREQARTVLCLSNLRQMAVAANSYSHSYRDRYPIAYYLQVTPIFTSFAWDFTTSKDWSTSPPTIKVVPGLLWDGAGIEEIHECPSYRGPHNWWADPYTGYNYNTSYIGHGSNEAIQQPAKTADVKNTGRTALFGDGQYSAGANKFMRAPWANPGDAQFAGRFTGTQGYRHSERTNVAFCDGHAETWSERHTATYPADRANLASGTGFLSPDNSLYDLE